MNGLLILLLVALPVLLLGVMADQVGDRWLERKVEAGWLPGLIKATSGSQPGFPRRWRRVMAHVSPWRLDCRGRYVMWWKGRIDVTAEPRWRDPSLTEYLRLVGRQHGFWKVIELETSTATLRWAVPAKRVAWAVSKVRGTESEGEVGSDGVHVPR